MRTSAIPEIYPGIEQEATRVGSDVYEMYAVVDAIAHEYELGEGDHMASWRSQLEWLFYQVGMLSFRAFAEGKATWVLNYSWDGDKNVDAKEAMKTLAGSQVRAGVNFWTRRGTRCPVRTTWQPERRFSSGSRPTKRHCIRRARRCIP
jgi:hypothetical protein